ncbi:MAG: hypothetical protein ABIP78_10425, partial [Pyrinomonadaceae bacterium]
MLVNKLRGVMYLVIVMAIGVIGANAATFTAAASGDWGSAATWTLNSGTDADGIPDADDTASIPNTRIVTVSSAQSVQNLTVNAGGTLTINAGVVLTLSGAAPSSNFTNGGTTNGAGIFRTQGTSSIAINGSSFTAALEIGGTTNALSSTIGGSVTILNAATLQTTNQIVTVNGDLIVNNGGLINSSSNNGTFTANGANVVNNGSITGISFRFGGTTNLSGAGIFTGNIQILNTAVTTLTSNVTFGNGV